MLLIKRLTIGDKPVVFDLRVGPPDPELGRMSIEIGSLIVYFDDDEVERLRELLAKDPEA